jgi:DNA-binding beta-propeller fold protein YncE
MPYGIALDLAAGKMYVINFTSNTISQANLDGTGGVSLGNLNGTLNGPSDIALDLAAGKMYVINFTGNTISQANLNGTGGVNLGNLNGTLNGPTSIAISGSSQQPLPRGVGGDVVPVSKISVIFPWLALAFIITILGVSLGLRYRKGS